jgi:excisionase family DNA binding protein
MSPYLTVKEAADFLRLEEQTVRNKMRSGDFKKGVHYYRRPNLHVLFKRAALEAYVEGKEQPENAPASDVIKMARGYELGR